MSYQLRLPLGQISVVDLVTRIDHIEENKTGSKGAFDNDALEQQGSMAKILLTEDDEAVRGFVGRALQIDGHSVVEAIDGEDGFDKLQEHAGEFDLLLTDIKMPFMDGIELSHLAASSYPNLKILMMTGFADQRERTGGLEKIVIDVVPKPFALKEIRAAVNDALSIDASDRLKKSA